MFAALAILGLALVWAARGVPHARAAHSSLRTELGAAVRDLRRGEVLRFGVANAGSYAVPQARLYSRFAGRSGAAVAVSNAGGLVGQTLPLRSGALGASFGLGAALWTLLLGPLGVLVLLDPRRDRPRAGGH